MSRTKEVVTFHAETWQEGRPAVNVKVYAGYEQGLAAFHESDEDGNGDPIDPAFTIDWIEENATDEDHEMVWFWAIESEREFLQESVRSEIWPNASIEYQGRSGGWATVEGIKPFEAWDATDLAKWRKFERFCAEAVQGLPFALCDQLYRVAFLPWREEKAKADALAYTRMDREVLA